MSASKALYVYDVAAKRLVPQGGHAGDAVHGVAAAYVG